MTNSEAEMPTLAQSATVTEKQHASDSNIDGEPPDTQADEQHSEDHNTESPVTEPEKASTDQFENQFTNEKLHRLQAVFEEADEDGGGGLNMEQFRMAMRTTMGDHITDEQLDMMFMKVDTNCDGTVDWDEYLTFMLLECRERDQMQVQSRQPFPRDAKVVQVQHKDTVVRAVYLPCLTQEDVKDDLGARRRVYRLDENNGKYVTASKEGVLQFWCTDMKSSTLRQIEPIPPQKSIWVTDIVIMPRASVLVASTTSGMLIFFDMSGNRFEKMSTIADLKGCPLAMSFWSNPSASGTDPQIMLIGDDRGSVLVIRFKRLVSKTYLNPKINRTGKNKFLMEELIRGGVKYVDVFHLKRIHSDAVKQVMYCPPLHLIFSCSKDEARSLFLGDFERTAECSYLEVKKGINAFAYCKQLNVLITGGYDAIVRVWNPYITTKPVITLTGHKTPILHILIDSLNEHVISIAENKDIRVHDLTTQTCIQSVFHKMLPNIGSQPISVAMFNERRQALIFGWKTLIMLQPKIQEVKELITSKEKVTVVLYNPIFHQVVTGGVDSHVTVWDVHTGEKVMQFKAHVAKKHGRLIDVEITAMTFGQRFRRLITAAQDGAIKIWNFNNGACLREVPATSSSEITSIVCTREKIVTAGWNKRVVIYHDNVDDDSYHLMSPGQPDDILTIAHYPPYLLASASHDGTIFVWSMETMRLIFITKIGHGDKDQSYMSLANTVNATEQSRDGSSGEQVPIEKDAPNQTHPELAVVKLVFLQQRANGKDTAILFAACSDGNVRAYSVHHEGGLKGQFHASKKSGCPLSALIADTTNNLIITGDNDGYVRVWDISHYCNAALICSIASDKERASYWRRFTYYNFQVELVNKRAKQGNTALYPPPVHRPDPLLPGSTVHLINSFHAHLTKIICLDYAQVHERDLLVSCSCDLSVRLWSINGEFLGIFGQPTVWSNFHSTDGSPEGQRSSSIISAASKHYLVPSDVRKVASATTLRVLNGGINQNWLLARNILAWVEHAGKINKIQAADTFVKAKQSCSLASLDEALIPGSILGKSYKQQMRHKQLPNLGKLAMYHTQCRAYKSLPCVDVENIQLNAICDVPELKRIQGAYKLKPLKHDASMLRKANWHLKISGVNKGLSDTNKKRGSIFKKQSNGKISVASQRGTDAQQEHNSHSSQVPTLPKLS